MSGDPIHTRSDTGVTRESRAQAFQSDQRACPGCGQTFAPSRASQVHCRPSCRRLALEQRRARQEAQAATRRPPLQLFE